VLKDGESLLSDRQKLILKAVVEDYAKKVAPVGSRALLLKPYLKVSSATIRSDMATLEELGYLLKTHTSSGRIPSTIGYQYYVEHLMNRNENVSKYFTEIDKIFNNIDKENEDIIKEAVEKLAELTNQYVVVLGTSANFANVKKMEVVPLTDEEAVLLIVTDMGQVQSQVIKLPNYVKMDDLLKTMDMFDNAMYDRSISEIKETLMKEAMKPRIRKIVNFKDDILYFLIKGFSRFQNTESYSAGLSNLISQPEFQNHESVQNILRMVDEETLKNLLNNQAGGLTINIGANTGSDYLTECTVVTAPYYFDENGYGCIAVVGPSRMAYSEIIPLVEYVANSISKLFR